MSEIDDFFNEQTNALENVVAGNGSSPDEAARAMEISRVTGHPALAVANDLPRFERDAQDELASTIVRDNPALQEYVNANPMAPRVSSDDWGSLDGITRKLENFRAVAGGWQLAGAQGFVEGLTEGGPLGSWMYRTEEAAEWTNKLHPADRLALIGLGLPLEAISRFFGGVNRAAAETAKSAYGSVTGDWDEARRFGREVGGIVEYTFNKPPTGVAFHTLTQPIIHNAQLRNLADNAGPYFRAGVEPPVGIDPILDKIKTEQAKLDGDKLDDLMRDVQGSSTRERAPELFANLMRQQTQANIYIPFDTVAKIYGEKPPRPDDNLLGWVPDIHAQVSTMSLTGGDIVVPLADWLAKADPKLAKEIHDNLRVRRGGFTIEEAKEYGDVIKTMADIDVFHGSPHSFDAFSMEAIGTGEGAQSYGHGLYFAENRQVADSYAQMGYRAKNQNEVVAMQALQEAGGDPTKAMQILDQRSNEPRNNTAMQREFRAAFNMLKRGWKPQDQGNMYRARIKANPEDFLDWDKALKDQAPQVVEVIKRIAQERNLEIDWEMSGEAAYKSAVWNFAPELGQGNVRVPGAKKASEFFNTAGIPGIRYLDQGSRFNNRKDNAAGIAELENTIRNIEAELQKGPDAELQSTLEAAKKELKKYEPTYNYVLFDDSLIEILDRNGEAVNAVRKQAGLEPLADRAEQPVSVGDYKNVDPKNVRYYSKDVKAYVLPKEEWHKIEGIIDAEVNKIIDRIAPGTRRQGAQSVEMEGRAVRGAYLSYNNNTPLILWSLDNKDPFHTARHEALHYLRDQGFFTKNEWETLRTAAIEGNWLDKHNITTRYKGKAEEIMIEEAIAEEYSKSWAKDRQNVNKALNKVFEKLHMLIVEIKEAIQKSLGYLPKAEDLFEMIESGEIGARKGTEPIPVDVAEGRSRAQKPEQLELDVTRQEDKAIFAKASAIGMTVPQYKKYLDLISKRNLEDIKAQRERAIALEKKRQTAEWKAEADVLEDEVRTDLRNRPDIVATDYFRYGELYGEKAPGRKPQFDASLLTPEERKLLPEAWVTEKGGMHPDDVANLFGYQTKAELIEKMAAYEAARGNVRPGEFFHRQVKAETERRMIERHGELDSNILAAAEDHVLGVTQMDLLHEETVALGMRSGTQISFTKEDVQGWVETKFNESRAKDASVVKLLDEAGKGGRAAELALLKGDFAEAFRQKQRQYFSAMLAKEAKGFEKETQRFEKLADRFSKREGPKAVNQEFTDQIQSLLQRAGMPVRRTEAELQEAFQRKGYADLNEFVLAKTADGYDLSVALYLNSYVNNVEKMSVQEAREFRSAIISLNHVGREVQKIEVQGAKEDFDKFKERVINDIRTMTRIPKDQNAFLKRLYEWDSELTKMEEIIKDLDLRKEAGPLWDVLIRPMAEAKHTEYNMMEELARRFKDMEVGSKEWQKTLDDTIPQSFFHDPEGVLWDLSRSDLIGIMLNWGNRSNIDKFVKGWARTSKDEPAVFEQKMRRLIDQHATVDDWKFVQSMWDMFEMWRRESNEMYYELSGVPPKWIDAVPLDTPVGQFRGGYFPVMYDKYWSDIPARDAGSINPDAVFFNYHRSTPVNHYVTERTGYVDYVEFNDAVSNVPARMQQEIHDIAYRRAIITAKKVIGDKSIRASIRQHYGPQYENQLTPWLQKIASQYNDTPELRGTNWALRRARYNLVAHALPLNLRVIFSPDVGTLNIPQVWNSFTNSSAAWDLVKDKSKELPHTFHNMDRDFRERLEQTVKAKGFDKFQADAARWAFAPAVWLSQKFRIATWIGEYQKRMAAGMDEGTAISMADSFVRERHGSASVADLPAIMTQGEGMKAMTMFYGYFNTLYNMQRQIPGAIRRRDMPTLAKALWGAVIIPSAFGAALFNQQRESDSWGKTIAKALIIQPLSTIPFARDFAQLYGEGYSARSPLASLAQATYSLYGDVKKYAQNKKMDKPITHVGNVIGLMTGLPMAQLSRSTQFGVDVYTGKQRPRNVIEWGRGIISGEARLKK